MARFSLWWLFGLTAIVAFGITACLNANIWWSLAVNGLALSLVLYAGVRSCVPRAPNREFWLAFTVSAMLSGMGVYLTGALIPLAITRYIAARLTGHDVAFGDDSRWWMDSPTEPRFRFISEMAHSLWAVGIGMLGGLLALYMAHKYEAREREGKSR